ncbi:MAG: phage portal protein [Acidobacteria bacterium]|nr:phage portal protein [Acidobacteriota bacterium]
MRNTPEGLYSIKGSKFEALDLPVIQEQRGKDYIKFGVDNLFPQQLIELYDSSAMNHTCIDAIQDGIYGEGIVEYGGEYINTDGETIDNIFEKISLDYTLFGGYALNLIWNKEGTRIAEIYHLPFANVRSGKPDEDDRVHSYYYSSDWSQIRKYKPVEYKSFDPTDNKKDNASQIYYCKDYNPGQEIYPLPAYIGGVNDIQLDARVSRFHNANISNGLAPSMFVQFRNGIPNPEERRDIYREIEDTFSGEENAGRFFLAFSEPGKELQVTPIENANDEYYIQLEQRITSRILTAHRITSPLLLGIKDGAGFSSNADEIVTSYSHFMNTVVRPKQTKILNTYGYILKLAGFNVKLEVEPVPMIIGTEADDPALEEDITNIADV